MPSMLPSVATNAAGDQRRIGLELEFAGIKPDEAAQIIASVFGGRIKKKHRYYIEVLDGRLGDFRVELDAQLLQRMAREQVFDKFSRSLDDPSIGKSIEDIVDKMARAVVPLEIVMPPVKIEQLGELDELRKELQLNRAEGTKASLVHAFGMHINIEMPDLKLKTLLAYFRSFLIVYPWLLGRLKVDISRRFSPYIDPFPKKYVRKILDPAYNPAQNQFIKEYLQFNPTRNRPLDLMPIFGMLNNDLIQPIMKGEKNDPRPALHYRLPNSHIDDVDWRFEDEWESWLVVEKLANQQELMRKLSRLYLLRERETVISFQKEWAETVTIMLRLDE